MPALLGSPCQQRYHSSSRRVTGRRVFPEAAYQERLATLRKHEGLLDLPKGRRPACKDGRVPLHEDLFTWLAVRRPKMYTQGRDDPLHLTCVPCQTVVKARRASTIHYVLQHRRSQGEGETLSWSSSGGQRCKGCRARHFLPSLDLPGMSMERDPHVPSLLPQKGRAVLALAAVQGKNKTWCSGGPREACQECLDLGARSLSTGRCAGWPTSLTSAGCYSSASLTRRAMSASRPRRPLTMCLIWRSPRRCTSWLGFRA